MTALGLLTGMVQAYIFSILAAVYIAAATRVAQAQSPHRKAPKPMKPTAQGGHSMDNMTLSRWHPIVIAGITTGFGTMGPALAKGGRSRRR
jgi:hypothetical protein